MPLLGIATGPRASAMGESFAALADDVTALYWNPAGLGQLKNPEFFLSHQEWFQDIRDEYLCAALPSGRGKLGLGLTFSGVSGIETWDADNQRGFIQTTSNYNGAFTLGYGVPIARLPYFGSDEEGGFLYAGGGAKLAVDYLGSAASSGFGAGADLGLLARLWPYLSVGLSLQNLGMMNYRTDNLFYQMPSNLRVGAAFRRKDLNIVSDLLLPVDNSPSFHIGGEYTMLNTITVRAGYKTGPQDVTTLGRLSGLCLGLGVRFGRFAVDYAFVPYGSLGSAHRIGIRTVVLPRGFGSLKIRAIDGRTNEPLAAELELSGIREARLAAGHGGKASVDKLPEGWLKVQATYPGYSPVTDSIYSYGDREQTMEIALGMPSRGTIWGQIFDAVTKKNIPGMIMYRGKAAGEVQIDERHPSYTLRDLLEGDYVLRATGPEDYFPQTCTVRVKPSRLVSKDFHLLRRKQRFVLKGANFETGKADLLPQYLSNLDEAGKILVENPTIVVELAGHTDPREINTPEFPSNWDLSRARAEAVRKYLIEKFKIEPERLAARGYADTQPIAPNNTEEGMARNRRTEFVVLEQ
jgi:outer membrane protein OmpA-like peptidoglycan-associated protein